MRSTSFGASWRLVAWWLSVALIGANGGHAQTAVQEMNLEDSRKLALELVNKSRAERKLPPLKLEIKLTVAAQRHAEDMYKRDFFAHNTPEGKTPADRFHAAGGSKWLLTAENIAMCDSGCKTPLQEYLIRQHHRDWMNSPGHRANILLEGLDSFGYGIIVDKTGKQYAVQTFSGPGMPKETSAIGGKPISIPQQFDILTMKINAKRKAAGRKPLQVAPGLSTAAANLAPLPTDKKFEMRRADDPMSAIPDSDVEKWQRLGVLGMQCSNCGLLLTDLELNKYLKDWFDGGKGSKHLLNNEFTHFGFVVVSDGQGRKAAVLVLGGPSPH
jgi:uncharacterized protein YkwD